MPRNGYRAVAAGLLIMMFFLAGGAALHESTTVDEVAHVGAGLSYLQCLDLRLNPEHPPLGKALAALPGHARSTCRLLKCSLEISSRFLPRLWHPVDLR